MILLKNMSQSPVIVWGKVVLWPRQQKEFDQKGKDKDIVSRLIRKRYIDSLELSDPVPSVGTDEIPQPVENSKHKKKNK